MRKKNLFLFMCLILSSTALLSQNTFPSSGSVGIGTSTPGTNLELISSGAQVEIKLRHSSEYSGWGFSIKQASDLSTSINAAGRDLQIQSGWDRTLFLGTTDYNANGGKVVFPGGKVGIGTLNPDQLLTVNGIIHSKEIKIDLSVPGPDYVFEKSYDLPSLDVVKSYIDENKHLPEVPSAKEMEKNGINVGEMNMLLLKKIEELTLYVIEIKRDNDELRSLIKK